MFSMIAEPPTRIGNSAPIRVTIDCAQCGTAIPSTQTKSLDSTLDTYRVGDVVSAEGITTGVLTEELYCEPCRKFDQKIYMTLWHGLITGFYTDEAEAERKLLAVDRADILYYLGQHSASAGASPCGWAATPSPGPIPVNSTCARTSPPPALCSTAACRWCWCRAWG